jgi:hypothetical protein
MPKRIDANQPQVVSGLRQVGATVLLLHTVGKGCPDIAVGFRGRNFLFEIKDGDKPYSKRQLTPDEETFFEEWHGQVSVVNSLDDALTQIGAI